MKNKFKYILAFILLILVMPMMVNATSIKLGSAKSEEGKTTFPIILVGNEIKTNDIIDLKGNISDNAMLKVGDVVYTNAIGKNGAAAEDKTIPGEGLEIGSITITNTIDSNQTGKFSIRGTYKPKAGGSEDLFINETSISVKAARAKSSNSKFTSLKPSQGNITPDFKSDTFDYTVYNIKDTIVSVRLNYTCDHCTISVNPNNTVTANASAITIGQLEKGDNKIEIKVTSENGEKTDTYNVNIIRGDTEFNSAKIKSISFNDYKITPDFKSDTYEYSLQVANSVKDISKIVSIDLADPTATYEIKDGDNLTVGENTVEITVTSALKDNVQIYVFKITRLRSEDIVITKYIDKKIYFIDSDQEKQEMTEEEFKNAYPSVWQDIQNGKYKFDEEGNVINTKETKDKKNSKTIIIIIILVVGLIIIGTSGYFIFRKKDPEKEKQKQEEKIKKKALKKARKDELKKLEEEYYNEYYDDEYNEDETDEEVEEEESTEESTEESEEPKSKKEELDPEEVESLVEDDYLFESTLVEEEQEEEMEKTKKKGKKEEVVDVDSALEDLMNTKTYDFSDELKDIDEE